MSKHEIRYFYGFKFKCIANKPLAILMGFTVKKVLPNALYNGGLENSVVTNSTAKVREVAGVLLPLRILN